MTHTPMDFPEHAADYSPQQSTPRPVVRPQSSMPQPRLVNDGHRYQYAVEKHSEGMLGTILFGASAFNPNKLSTIINKRASAGYRMVFQIKEQRRMFIFWKRECILMTFEKSLS